MARRITERQRLAFKLDSLSDSEVKEVLDYLSVMDDMRRERLQAQRSPSEDDLLSLLADAPENLRARQAFEWETIRRRAERRSSSAVPARI